MLNFGVITLLNDEEFIKREYNSENVCISEAIKIILENYPNFLKIVNERINNNEEIDYPKENGLLTFISSKFPKNSFDKIVNKYCSEKFLDKFHTIGSTRHGVYPPTTPFLAIVNQEDRQNITVSKTVSVVYIFRADRSGLYLNFSIGSDILNEFNVEKLREEISKKYHEVNRSQLDSELFSSEYMDLRCSKEELGDKGYTCDPAKKYEKGMIFNKFYSNDSDELTDENLLNDLEKYIQLYEFIIDNDMIEGFRQKSDIIVSEDGNNIVEKSEYQSFREYLLKKGFYFKSETIINYLLSLKVKPFIILTGNSGTGKTQLAKLFAEYMSEKNDNYDNYRLVPVGANWTENRNVVGYYNVLTKDYQKTHSLELLLQAKENISKPYFLILDEMNLSHVERYFSDFLSSMESKKPILLHKSSDEYGGDVPEDLVIPKNVFIIGTVNVDETTYMFSPKVLDRANVLEFKSFENLPLIDYIKIKFKDENFYENEFNEENINYLENVLSDHDLRDNILDVINEKFDKVKYDEKNDVENLNNNEQEENECFLLEKISDELSWFNENLKDSSFEFGYRTVNEILAFMYVAWKYEGEPEYWNNWKRYFDAQLLQKILPKLHGSQIVIGKTLDDLLTHCLGVENSDDIANLSEDCPYPRSAKKLIQMKDVLEKQRYMSFIN